MSDVIINTDAAVDEAEQPVDAVEDGVEAADGGVEPEQQDTQDSQMVDTDAVLRNAKLEALIAAYLPKGTDVEEELAHVGGLSINDEGKLVGEAKYRKPPVKPSPRRAQTTKPNPRRESPTPVDDWPAQRESIRQRKIAAGIISNYS